MDPTEAAEARRTLEQLEGRLRDDARRMAAVLAADVPAFVRRVVRRAFVEAPAADGLDDGAVARLKAETEAAAERLAGEVQAELGPLEAWLWREDAPPPAAADDLRPNPRVAAVLDRVEEAISGLLGGHGLPLPPPAERAYALPTYFVAGEFMRSLVESYWRTLALHHELARDVAAADQEDERRRREARWDEA